MAKLPAIRKATRRGIYHLQGFEGRGKWNLKGQDDEKRRPRSWYERVHCGVKYGGDEKRCSRCGYSFKHPGYGAI